MSRLDNNNHLHVRRTAVTAAVVATLVPAAAYPAAGRVQFAIGNVIGIDKDGNERRLRRGAALEEGDTVRTARGRAQIRFSDGAYTSLQPDTEFRIDGYEYDAKQEESSRGFFSLLKGGLRTITGAIGKLRKRSYRLSTPVATIGIRGTEYTAVLGNSLSVNVGLGTITATNDAGTLVIANGESAFVAGPGSFPLLTPDKPVLPPPVVGQRTDDGEDDSGDYQLGTDRRVLARAIGGEGLRTGSGFAIAVAYGDDAEGSLVQEIRTGQDAVATALGAAAASVPDGIPNEADLYVGAPTFGAINQNGELVAFSTGSPDGGQIAALTGGAVRDAGIDAGTIGWGRWVGGLTVAGSQYDSSSPTRPTTTVLNPNQGHHYVIGRPTSIADMAGQIGNVVYNLAGATRPTIDDGRFTPGFVDPSSTMTAHFGAQRVSMDLRFTLGGSNYRIDTAAQGASLGIQGRQIAGSGNFTSLGGSTNLPTFVEGYFAGSNASHMGVAYKVDRSGSYITGAAAFRRGGPGAGPPTPPQ